MKKTIAKLICLIMVASFSLTAFAACDWITTNTDRDMAQVIASVRIDAAVEKEDIYKRQLVAGYVSYGYQYVQYYGYTNAKAYQLVLDNLVNNRIIIQQSRIKLAETYNALLDKNDDELNGDFETYFKTAAQANGERIDPKSGSLENLAKYLTEYEEQNAYYTVRKNINSMIDSYMDSDDDTDEKEDVTYTARTAPTEDSKDDLTEKELKEETPTDHDYQVADLTLNVGVEALKQEYHSVYELDLAVWKAYKIDLSTSARKKAFNKIKEDLLNSGLLTKAETDQYNKAYVNYVTDPENVLKLTYFAESLKSQLESKLVSKYQDSLVDSVQSKLTDDAVWEQYNVDYDNQVALYRNDYSSYESALDSASDTSFVLYDPFDNYGYVANLLIGFSEEQSSKLSELKSKKGVTNEEIKDLRDELVAELFAKDQRDSWVYLNYGTYAEGEDGGFTFEDKYNVSDLEVFDKFLGTVEVASADGYEEKDDDGVTVTKWKVTKAKATPVAFNTFIDTYLSLAGIGNKRFEADNDNYGVLAGYENTELIEMNEEDLNKIKELIYVFSTDPGSLSSEYGYLYSPITSSTKYVSEFAAAAKLVVEQGVGAYTLVTTDYGVHVIVCTKLVREPYAVPDGKDAFMADLENEDTIAYKYKQVKLDSVTSNAISRIANQIINGYRDDDTKVTYYENNYKDLVEETSAS